MQKNNEPFHSRKILRDLFNHDINYISYFIINHDNLCQKKKRKVRMYKVKCIILMKCQYLSRKKYITVNKMENNSIHCS